MNGAGVAAFSAVASGGVFGVFSASTVVGPVTPLAGASEAFQLVDPPALNTIQATPDLIQPFTPIGTRVVASDGAFQFDEATGATQRFYRVTLP